MTARASNHIKLARVGLLAGALMICNPEAVFAQTISRPQAQPARPFVSEATPPNPQTVKDLITMDDRTSVPGAAEMKAAQARVTRLRGHNLRSLFSSGFAGPATNCQHLCR